MKVLNILLALLFFAVTPALAQDAAQATVAHIYCSGTLPLEFPSTTYPEQVSAVGWINQQYRDNPNVIQGSGWYQQILTNPVTGWASGQVHTDTSYRACVSDLVPR